MISSGRNEIGDAFFAFGILLVVTALLAMAVINFARIVASYSDFFML